MKHEREFTTRVLPMLCSAATIARELDCGRSKAYQLISDGTLPSVKVDGMVRVPAQALKDYIAQCLKNSGLESTEESSSQSSDTAQESAAAASALRLDRISRPMRKSRSTA